jgi:lysophospholipase L1-like esterase
MHQGAVVTSYRTADNTGDQSASETASAFTLTTTQMWWLKAVDVYSTNTVGTVVGFADSITDGTCTTLDAHNRWEDHVSMRMDVGDNSFRVAFGAAPLIRASGLRTGGTESIALHKAVVNEGIGGNTITRDNLQPPPDSIPGIERLDRDVLSHSGVTHVVLFMGTNDIRREASAAQVIAGMQNIIDRVRAHGIKIIGATIIPRHNVPPSGTNTGWNDAKTAIRNQVNAWIRTQAPFDGVIDFDAVVRDPANPDLIYPAFNCGDGIHPSPAGYYQMGKAVDLDLFGTRDRN